MTDFEGRIVYRGRDEYGEIIVADNALQRTLYFGTKAKQSRAYTDRPAGLPVPYTQAMMSALIFNCRPKRALFLGVGGGSMIRFLQRVCSACLIDAVELRGRVVDVAHGYFGLPRNHPRLHITIGDAKEFVLGRHERRAGYYDLMFVDIFDDSGPVPIVRDMDFVVACSNMLARDGIFVINLWDGPEHNYPWHRAMIDSVFNGGSLALVLGKKNNAIVFGFRNPVMMQQLRKRLPAAKELQTVFDYNVQKYLREIMRQNGSFFSRWFGKQSKGLST